MKMSENVVNNLPFVPGYETIGAEGRVCGQVRVVTGKETQ